MILYNTLKKFLTICTEICKIKLYTESLSHDETHFNKSSVLPNQLKYLLFIMCNYGI